MAIPLPDGTPDNVYDAIPLTTVSNSDIDENGSLLPELKWQERNFLNHYVVHFNATRAAIAAGYAESGARAVGCRLLQRPHIRLHLEEMLTEQRHKSQFIAERVMHELTLVAFADPTDLLNADGSLRKLHELPPGIRQAVKKYSVDEHGNPSYEFHDKLRALNSLGHYLGMNNGGFIENEAAVDEDETPHVVITLPDNNRTPEALAKEK